MAPRTSRRPAQGWLQDTLPRLPDHKCTDSSFRPRCSSRGGSCEANVRRTVAAVKARSHSRTEHLAEDLRQPPNSTTGPGKACSAPMTINCDLRDVPEEMIRTPPAWRRPWDLLGAPEMVHPGQPLTSSEPKPLPRLLGASISEPKPSPYLMQRGFSKDLWSPESPRKTAKVLNELMPLYPPHMVKRSPNLRSSMLALMGVMKAKRKLLHTSAQPSASASSEVVTNATGGTCPIVTTDAEVVAFRHTLAKSCGNLTRAFRAMKRAAHSAGENVGFGSSPGDDSCSTAEVQHHSEDRLNYKEFEWCVVAHLHYGNRKCARRLFDSMDSKGTGFIGLLEFVQPPATQTGLMSLVEFRGRLLERHTSLWQAFRELEEHLDKNTSSTQEHHIGNSNRTMRLAEFINATVFFGLNPEQATSFFNLMDTDGNGTLTLKEFMDALTQMPRHILLHDFRQRLLGRFASINVAFQEVAGKSGLSARLRCADFEIALVRIGIDGVEAQALFRVIDDDDSGDISLQELQDALRVAAPFTSLAEFWHRLAFEWPEIAACALLCGEEARQRARLLLADLMPRDILMRHGGGALPGDTVRRRVPSKADAGPGDQLAAIAQECPTTLHVLTADTFDALTILLDISYDNAMQLFHCIVSGTGSKPSDEPAADNQGMEIYVEDFLEQLQLWAADSSEDGAVSNYSLKDIRRAIAPGKAAIMALKRELSPIPPTTATNVTVAGSAPQETSSETSGTSKGRSTRGRKLPWVSHCSSRRPSVSPIPV